MGEQTAAQRRPTCGARVVVAGRMTLHEEPVAEQVAAEAWAVVAALPLQHRAYCGGFGAFPRFQGCICGLDELLERVRERLLPGAQGAGGG